MTPRPITAAEVNAWLATPPPFDGTPAPRRWVRLRSLAGRLIRRWGA